MLALVKHRGNNQSSRFTYMIQRRRGLRQSHHASLVVNSAPTQWTFLSLRAAKFAMRGHVLVALAVFTAFLAGCGGTNPTEPDVVNMDFGSPELAPLLNTQGGRQFAEAPWDVNTDGKIDVFDLMMVAQHFGEEGEPGSGNTVLEIISRSAPANSVSVSGSGVATGVPDVAFLSLGVSVLRDSVQAAREEAAVAMQGVIDSLKANGVADLDIQTQQFSIQQQYDYTNNRRELIGYQVTNLVSVKVRDLEGIGQVIDDAAEAGGDLVQINSIQFGIDDTTEMRMQARIAAMRDALAKAQTLAAEGGVTLGKPVSITEASSFVQPPAFERGAFDEAASITPIQTGQLQVSVTVSVVYAIE